RRNLQRRAIKVRSRPLHPRLHHPLCRHLHCTGHHHGSTRLMEFIADFFNAIWGFLETIPSFADDILVKLSAWYVIWVTKAKIYFVGFAWDVAQEVLNQLNISATINQYWGSIDSK